MPPPQPRNAARFDPWNSSSTGHQRADHRPGTAWRDARGRKLNAQFRGGPGPEHDARLPAPAPRSVADLLARPGLMRKESLERRRLGQDKGAEPGHDPEDRDTKGGATEPSGRAIFDGVVVYVNGSTFPLVSDHRLKQLLRENGARVSLHLARRAVTHVVLARAGASGGLAGGKMDREIRRTAGCGVKYIDVEWWVSPPARPAC